MGSGADAPDFGSSHLPFNPMLSHFLSNTTWQRPKLGYSIVYFALFEGKTLFSLTFNS